MTNNRGSHSRSTIKNGMGWMHCCAGTDSSSNMSFFWTGSMVSISTSSSLPMAACPKLEADEDEEAARADHEERGAKCEDEEEEKEEEGRERQRRKEQEEMAEKGEEMLVVVVAASEGRGGIGEARRRNLQSVAILAGLGWVGKDEPVLVPGAECLWRGCQSERRWK